MCVYITCASATAEVSVTLTLGWRERRSAEGAAMRRTAPTSAGGAWAGSPRRCLAVATTAAPLFGWPGADRKEACGPWSDCMRQGAEDHLAWQWPEFDSDVPSEVEEAIAEGCHGYYRA